MKKVFLIVSFFLLFIIQTTCEGSMAIFGIMPNFLMVFSVLYSMRTTPAKAGVIGCICGLAFDLSATGIFGFDSLIMLYTCVGASMISNRFYCENIFVSSGLVWILGFMSRLLKLMITSLIYTSVPFWSVVSRYLLPESVINALLALILFWWVRWLNNEYIRGL